MAKSLYERLGGADGVERIVGDAVSAHLGNPIIKTRFQNASDIDYSKKMLVEFFSMGSGGPGEYTGRDMLTTHKGMNISEQEFMAVVDDVFSSMDKNNVGEDEKKDVLAIFYSLKEEIVRV